MKKIIMIFITFITLLLFLESFAYGQSFAGFINEVKQQALAEGISQHTLNEAFDHVKHLHRVIHRDRNQAEFTRPYAHYLRISVTPARVQAGRDAYEHHHQLLTKISRQYHVPSNILVALWGLETNYGKVIGSYPEFSALSTLAYDKRRGRYFKRELFDALKIVNDNLASMKDMHGSWAGAMGQCQFMPSRFLQYRVDYTHDGRADIWHNTPDALASAANYLHSEDWNNSATVVYPVILTKAIRRSYVGLRFKRPVRYWQRRGIEITDKNLRSQFNAQKGNYSLLLPTRKNMPAYLVNRHNFGIILRWNRSIFYALTVGILANKVV